MRWELDANPADTASTTSFAVLLAGAARQTLKMPETLTRIRRRPRPGTGRRRVHRRPAILWGSKTGHRLLTCGFACCIGCAAGSIAGL